MKWNAFLAGSLLLVGAAACGDPDPVEREQQPVDHASVQQTVSLHTSSVFDGVGEGLALLFGSSLYDDYLGGYDAACSGHGYDTPDIPGESGGYDSGGYDYGCDYRESEFEDLSTERDDFLELLETRILTEANVEVEGGDYVVYLLRGDVLCDVDDFNDAELHQECVDDVDAAEIRLRASTYVSGAVTLEVLMGPDQIHPATFTFSAQEVSVLLMLDELEAAAAHFSEIIEEEMGSFPERLEGRIKLGYYAQGSQVKVGVDIVRDVVVEAGPFHLELARANDAFVLTADQAAQTIGVLLGLNSVSAQGEYQQYLYEEPVLIEDPYEPYQPEEPSDPVEPVESDPIAVGLELAGLTAAITLLTGEEHLQLRNLGLGQGAARLFVQDQEVVEVNLNASQGRNFDADLILTEHGVQIDVSPAFDLQVALMLYRVLDDLEDLEDWMLDDILRVTLDGDANPAVRFGEYGLEVLRGNLRLRAQAPSVDITAAAGMCLDEGYHYDESEPFHPFTALDVMQCQ